MHLKYVLRRLIHAPGFTLATILTLAVGIGANSAIFAVIDSVLLKPLPYPNAERLVAVNHTAPGINFQEAGSASFLYFTYRDEGRLFEASGVWRPRKASITGLAEPEEVDTVDVTADMLPALGVSPAIGRWFSEKDDAPGTPETVILTYGYWKTRFGGDPSVLGQRIIVDGSARDKISAIPGVSSAGIVNVLPMTTKAPINGVWAQDQPDQATHVPKLRRFKLISPGLLQTMDTPLVAGREFTWTDTHERRPVAMVSENLARELWGDSGHATGSRSTRILRRRGVKSSAWRATSEKTASIMTPLRSSTSRC